MIKVITALPRRADFDRAGFQRHWGTVHRDFALQIDRISRYVQSHPVDVDLPHARPLAYDGFPEVWFPDLDAALALGSDPQYAEGAHLDEPRFIDVERMVRTWVDPVLVRPWPELAQRTDAGKILVLCAAERTAEVRERIVDALGVLAPRRAVVGTALDDPRVADRHGFGQTVELWWADRAEAETAWREGAERFWQALDGVVDPATSTVALVAEQRVRWPGDVVDAD